MNNSEESSVFNIGLDHFVFEDIWRIAEGGEAGASSIW